MFSELWQWIKTSRLAQWLIAGLILSLLLLFIVNEVFQSSLQSIYLSAFSRSLTYEVQPGASDLPAFGADGPFDQRLGYSRLSDFTLNASQSGFRIESQARLSNKHAAAIRAGIFPIYREKTQTGLELRDRSNQIFFRALYPGQVFANYEAVPNLIVQSLLFIENRDLLDDRYPGRNPAVEWDRFGKALVDVGLKVIKPSHKAVGGSTLATQIEKFRHSPGGRTASGSEKIKQMISASLRAYLDGSDTTKARQRIILDYINSIPLSGIPNYGEVNGLGDGLMAWYGLDLSNASAAISDCEDKVTADCASSFKKVLSLFVAQRRPSYYLARRPDSLERLTNTYLRLLWRSNIISQDLYETAINQSLNVVRAQIPVQEQSFVTRKADNRVRTYLLEVLGVERLYELDRLDLQVDTSLNTELQNSINNTLLQLADDEFVSEHDLKNPYLLSTRASLKNVVYSFTLFERGPTANYLRVSTDNYNQPLNINSGVKLDLGSTAKLRTLVTYLEIVGDLYERYSALTTEQLKAMAPHRSDRIGAWVREQLLGEKVNSLEQTLERSMLRVYSGSTKETFFTGSGAHTFANFKHGDSFKSFTVAEAFRHSVNLPFIRLMRDIVNYFIYNPAFGLGQILEDATDTRRAKYLARFADAEGRQFQRRFYKKYAGKTRDDIIKVILQNVRETPERYTAVIRALLPDLDLEQFAILLRMNLESITWTTSQTERLYKRYQYALGNLPDRGFIARIHPLEIWTAAYLINNPTAPLREVLQASQSARQEVYKWLFTTRHRNAQDTRLRIMLETEAFLEIHKYWKRVGYPFESLVPSYATSIGSSADRPAALAELMGIILNDGKRQPTILVNNMLFGADTPYETHFKKSATRVRQVIRPEVAKTVRSALADIVENGTARRIRGVFKSAAAEPLAIGGKTGTGDHRFDHYSSNGKLLSSQVVNRTATFVFYLGDRFFGTVVAYVSGPEAANYRFTSALPVQILKILAPDILAAINSSADQEVK